MKDVTKVNKVEGQGSVWNNNSYHWEEKSVKGWAEETMKKILTFFYYKQDKVTMTIKEVKEVKGESSVSVRKGKKIVTYEYAVKILFKIDLADESNTKSVGSVEGIYEWPEISNDVLDDGEEWDVNISY
jgi:activator of HSP90 ATPase